MYNPSTGLLSFGVSVDSTELVQGGFVVTENDKAACRACKVA